MIAAAGSSRIEVAAPMIVAGWDIDGETIDIGVAFVMQANLKPCYSSCNTVGRKLLERYIWGKNTFAA